jgi:hypothetical protein
MLLFGTLLTFFDDTYWPLVIENIRSLFGTAQSAAGTAWGVSVWFGAGELMFQLCSVQTLVCIHTSVHRS